MSLSFEKRNKNKHFFQVKKEATQIKVKENASLEILNSK